MSAPRGLSAEEAAIWAKVAETVTPLEHVPSKAKAVNPAPLMSGKPREPVTAPRKTPPSSLRFMPRAVVSAPTNVPLSGAPSGNLDSHWERKVKSGRMEPDFTLDLHGAGLDAAHKRLMRGVAQARAMGARVMLVIAGKPRPADPADRGARRGAIRAKLLDWLAASEHADAVSAVRKAHRSHGGEGALYLVLRRER
ncbi:Smr/MutS family protein [Erythrobacter sp. W53]|uniref:Smr/MutS family protein n=1 Tax=Erythrobacter sp. W53 TaxID=3425947 RepID=UPI003D767DEC